MRSRTLPVGAAAIALLVVSLHAQPPAQTPAPQPQTPVLALQWPSQQSLSAPHCEACGSPFGGWAVG